MIDKLIRFGSGFDWITPSISLIGRARGKVTGVRVPADWIPFVRSTLTDAGIGIHNDFVYGNDYVFDVRSDDIDQVSDLLGLVKQ